MYLIAVGCMKKDVHSFTLFDNIKHNDTFLELINYADGSDGAFDVSDGLWENLRCYFQGGHERAIRRS